jgi:CubicO group peptidase (beta-lactamase class C family)
MHSAKVPGVAVAILKNGKVLYTQTYGVSNLELNTPVTPRTVFELASLTKQFTSALIITLAHEGKLSLDDHLVKYIPNAPEAWNPITIRQLLGHMGGLALAFEPKMDGSYLLNYSKELMLKGAMETPMLTTPGTKWKYSDEGYFLAGYALEKATGRNFDTLMIDRIFKPIGMAHTLFLNQDNIIPNRAEGYIIDKNGQYKHNRRSWQFELTPHFGVMSTIQDMILYEQALVKGNVIKPEVLKEATAPYRIFSDNADGQYAYGMGWQLYTQNGRRVAEHAGYTGTVFVRDLKTGISVILLTNRDAAFGPSPILLAHHISAIVDPAFPNINLH